jgi:predicted nucleic acid-binding protein
VTLLQPWLARHEVATSIVVYGEVVEYLKQFPDFERRHADLRTFLREVTPHFVTYPIMLRYAELRRQMRRGGLIGEIDTLIAATALERNLTVVTSDTDYQKVPGLQVLLLTRESLRSR